MAFFIMNRLSKYAEAVQEHAKGNREGAALKMSQALGSEEVLQPVRQNIDRLVKPSDALADSMLKMMRED